MVDQPNLAFKLRPRARLCPKSANMCLPAGKGPIIGFFEFANQSLLVIRLDIDDATR